MSEFFKSEMVRGEVQEIMELQRYCFQCAAAFPVLTKEKKKEYFDVLEQLIEKQKIFNTRLALSDDPEAVEMADTMKQAAIMLGGNPNVSLTVMFDDLSKKVSMMKEKLEAEG